MRTTVTIPDALLKEATRRAAERHITLSGLIEDALREHLPPEAFRLQTVRGRLVNPGIDLDRTSALVAAEDEANYRKRAVRKK